MIPGGLHMPKQKSSEIEVLGTHQAAVTDLFETRKTAEPQIINPPVSSPGVYDERERESEG
jgi:hypothetical protein